MPFNCLIPYGPLPLLPSIFPSITSFLMSQLITSGGQTIGASALATVLPMSIQGWFPLGLTGLISLQSKGLLRVFFSTTVQKYQFFGTQPSLWSNSHIHAWLPEKTQLWLYVPLSAKWCLCFSFKTEYSISWDGLSYAVVILWPPHAKSWLIGKDPDAGRDWGQEEKGITEDEMAGWHHRLDRHEFE